MGADVQHRNADERISVNLRRLRMAAGISQAELARLMREHGWPWHQSTVHRLESGKQAVSLGEGVDLAVILGTTIDGLIQPAPEADAAEKVLNASASVENSADIVSEAVRVLLGARADAEKLFAATEGTPWPHVDALRQNLAEIAGMHTVEAAVAEGIRRYQERSDNEGGAALPTGCGA
jgi:transcriptional regulator with XRE-family HTH domain